MHLGLFLLTLLAALLLGFLLRASALIKRVEVNRAQHVYLRGHLFFALQGEDLLLWGLGGFGSWLGLFCRGLFLGSWHQDFRFRLFVSLLRLCFLGSSRFFNLLWLWLLRFLFQSLWFLLILHLWLGLLSFWLRLGDLCRFLFRLGLFLLLGGLADGVEVYLAQRRKRLLVLVPGLHDRFGPHLLLGLLIFLWEYHASQGLDVFVAFELLYQCVVLLVTDLGVNVGVVLNLSQARLVLQILDGCLKSDIQFR